MPTERYFQYPEEKRLPYIERSILTKFPEEKRKAVTGRVVQIVENYEGHDINALSVLTYAAEKGRFDEFALKLENFYQQDLQFKDPAQREIIRDYKAEEFFQACYRDLLFEPRSQTQ